MRTIALAALLLTFGAAPEAQRDTTSRYSDTLERPFAPAGTVRLNLSAGDYRLSRGVDDRIHVAWQTRDVESLNQSRVDVTVRGKEAAIHTSRPRRFGNNHFRVDIELPRRTDLLLRMTAGDLTISGIEGHKDVLLRAGDLTIEVADPEQYKLVNASVTAGDISARPFGFSTGGLFRNFAHSGPGRYQLRARLWAGDLKLLPARVAVK
jgi:hypothetical protein